MGAPAEWRPVHTRILRIWSPEQTATLTDEGFTDVTRAGNLPEYTSATRELAPLET